MENLEKIKPQTSKTLLIISWIFSLLFLFIGISSVLPENIGLTFRIENQIYWFVLSFATFIIPYISEVTFKDFNVKLLKEMKDTQSSIDTLMNDVNHLISLQINKSRIELIKGYHLYLDQLPHSEKYEKVKNLSNIYVEEIGMNVSDIKHWLKDLGYNIYEFSNDYTSEFYEGLKAFQADNNLHPDGICGYLTHKKIQEAFQKKQN